MKIIRYIVLFVGIYIVSWTVIYAVLMKFNFKYYFNYLWLSWTSPGEVPAYIQVVSLILTVLSFIGIILFKYLFGKG